jgi:hypothetical protein
LKKLPKKLVLSRETLVDLDRMELPRALGGAVSQTCRPNFCDFSGRNTCTTCQLTCTTNFC